MFCLRLPGGTRKLQVPAAYCCFHFVHIVRSLTVRAWINVNALNNKPHLIHKQLQWLNARAPSASAVAADVAKTARKISRCGAFYDNNGECPWALSSCRSEILTACMHTMNRDYPRRKRHWLHGSLALLTSPQGRCASSPVSELSCFHTRGMPDRGVAMLFILSADNAVFVVETFAPSRWHVAARYGERTCDTRVAICLYGQVSANDGFCERQRPLEHVAGSWPGHGRNMAQLWPGHDQAIALFCSRFHRRTARFFQLVIMIDCVVSTVNFRFPLFVSVKTALRRARW